MEKIVLTLFFSCCFSFVFSQNLFPYLETSMYGFCDADGKVVIAPQYQEVHFFDELGFANVRKDSLWSIIDKKGREYLPFRSSKQYTVRQIPNCFDNKVHDCKNEKKLGIFQTYSKLLYTFF